MLTQGDGVFGAKLAGDRKAALKQDCEDGAGAGDGLEVVVEGRVTRRRWFSSKVFFFDVSSPADTKTAAPIDSFVGEQLHSAPRLACIYKHGAARAQGKLKAADVVALAGAFQLGDWVRVRYLSEQGKGPSPARSMQAWHLEVLLHPLL